MLEDVGLIASEVYTSGYLGLMPLEDELGPVLSVCFRYRRMKIGHSKTFANAVLGRLILLN